MTRKAACVDTITKKLALKSFDSVHLGILKQETMLRTQRPSVSVSQSEMGCRLDLRKW